MGARLMNHEQFDQYKKGYDDLSKALGKLKLMHQDSKIEVENVVDRLLPIIEKQQIQTHQLIKAMTEVCMVLHKRILKLENKK